MQWLFIVTNIKLAYLQFFSCAFFLLEQGPPARVETLLKTIGAGAKAVDSVAAARACSVPAGAAAEDREVPAAVCLDGYSQLQMVTVPAVAAPAAAMVAAAAAGDISCDVFSTINTSSSSSCSVSSSSASSLSSLSSRESISSSDSSSDGGGSSFYTDSESTISSISSSSGCSISGGEHCADEIVLDGDWGGVVLDGAGAGCIAEGQGTASCTAAGCSAAAAGGGGGRGEADSRARAASGEESCVVTLFEEWGVPAPAEGAAAGMQAAVVDTVAAGNGEEGKEGHLTAATKEEWKATAPAAGSGEKGTGCHLTAVMEGGGTSAWSSSTCSSSVAPGDAGSACGGSSLGFMSEASARFYLGCVLLALEWLHERNIIHRYSRSQICKSTANA